MLQPIGQAAAKHKAGPTCYWDKIFGVSVLASRPHLPAPRIVVKSAARVFKSVGSHLHTFS